MFTKKINTTQLKNHYLFNGIREGRVYKITDKNIDNVLDALSESSNSQKQPD